MSEEDTIFETPAVSVEIKKEEPVRGCAAEIEEVAPVVKKKRTRKREYSPEQREKMLDNLKKGRAASLKKRQAKKELKKEVKSANNKTANEYLDRKLASEGKLLSKIDKLEKMIMNMNTPKPNSEAPKPAPKPIKVEPNALPKPAPKTKPLEVAKAIPIPQLRSLSTYKKKNKWAF